MNSPVPELLDIAWKSRDRSAPLSHVVVSGLGDMLHALPPNPHARCVCGLTRRQHETGWPACRGYTPDSNFSTTPIDEARRHPVD